MGIDEDSAFGRMLPRPSATVSFADVAHQTLLFDKRNEADRLVLELIDTKWLQRLRQISQTGNTKLVYMFSEHSRFGHSLGVAYLALLLMKHLSNHREDLVSPYRNAMAAAALLHDIGHIAPGSHLAERIWAPKMHGSHEKVSIRIIREDPELKDILNRCDPGLTETVCAILQEDDSVPPWTKSVIGGGGWNADRGNWAIVDSAMCSVSYGRYNVTALIDAFFLSEKGELLIQESRIDALTHFFVARDSMYRQVYQHRVLQAADALSKNIVLRLRDLISESSENPSTLPEVENILKERGIYSDKAMQHMLICEDYAEGSSIDYIFQMTESWWDYHVRSWCSSEDEILRDLCSRYRDRRLFKTVRINSEPTAQKKLLEQAKYFAEQHGYPARYYVNLIQGKDKHREKNEQPPMALLDSGEIVPVTEIEPMIDQIMKRPPTTRSWIAVPKKIKESLGRTR